MAGLEPLHIVIRYSDRLLGVDTIARHKEVLRKHKQVWLGKIGRGLTTSRFEAQLAAGIPTFVYLAKQGPRGLQFVRARLVKIQRDEPTEFLEAVPPYYFEYRIVRRIGMWMLVKSIQAVDQDETQELITQQSARRVTATLKVSSAGAFIVERIPVKEQSSLSAYGKARQTKLASRPDPDEWDEADEEFEFRGIQDDV